MPRIAYFLNVGICGCSSPSLTFHQEPSRPTPGLLPPPRTQTRPRKSIGLPSESHGQRWGPLDSPSIKGVLPRDDVRAVPAHKELDAVVEGVQVLLGHRGLCLLDDVQWVRGAQAQRVDMTEGLEAAVGVHAVHQAIYRGDRTSGLYCHVHSATGVHNAFIHFSSFHLLKNLIKCLI